MEEREASRAKKRERASSHACRQLGFVFLRIPRLPFSPSVCPKAPTSAHIAAERSSFLTVSGRNWREWSLEAARKREQRNGLEEEEEEEREREQSGLSQVSLSLFSSLSLLSASNETVFVGHSSSFVAVPTFLSRPPSGHKGAYGTFNDSRREKGAGEGPRREQWGTKSA